MEDKITLENLDSPMIRFGEIEFKFDDKSIKEYAWNLNIKMKFKSGKYECNSHISDPSVIGTNMKKPAKTISETI